MRLSEAFELYIQDVLWENNRSHDTEENYRQALTSLVKTIGNIDVESLTKALVREWSVWLRENLALSTERNYKSKLINVMKLTNKRGITSFDVGDIILPKLPKRLPKYLLADEVQRLISFAKCERDALIAVLFFYTGIRLTELATLKRSNLRDGIIRVFGKGAKEREIPLNSVIEARLRMYILGRVDSNPYVFYGYRKRNLGGDAIQRIIRDMGKRAGIQISPHVLRHSFATDLHVNGMDIRDIQYFLGHEFLSTTEIYTHIVPDKARQRFLECQTIIS